MPIEIGRAGKTSSVLAALLLVSSGALAAEAAETTNAEAAKPTAAEKTPESESTDWQTWTAGTSVSNTASLQRGARNFVAYCIGCHSLRFVRWSRIGEDLHIPVAELQQALIPPGDKPADYILTSMPAKDAEVWFGKQPPEAKFRTPLLYRHVRHPIYLGVFLAVWATPVVEATKRDSNVATAASFFI